MVFMRRHAQERVIITRALSLSRTFLWAACRKMFITVTNAASHDVARPVLGVLTTSMAFTARVTAVAFPFAFQVDKGVVVSPKETMSF